ncbi:MAG: T9SS type A sorting domain-containing protein [Bacteroidota bacterium]
MKKIFTVLGLLVFIGCSGVLIAQTTWLPSDTVWGYRTDKNYSLLNYTPDESYRGIDGDLSNSYAGLQNSWTVGANNDVWYLEASFYYDLQQPKTLNAFKIYSQSSYPYGTVDNFQVYYSDNPTNGWTLALNQTMPTTYGLDWYFYTFPNQTARYWKLTAKPKDKSFDIKEIGFGAACTDYIIKDTTTYSVSDNNFNSNSIKVYFDHVDSLYTTVGGCDSLIFHYSKFIYNPTYCSVTDTLVIDVTLTGVAEPSNLNTLKIYPNPTKTFVIINTGNYSIMNNYTIRIENLLGQQVFQTLTNQQEFQIDVNNFGGTGTYIVKIIDNTSNVVTTRKIVLN